VVYCFGTGSDDTCNSHRQYCIVVFPYLSILVISHLLLGKKGNVQLNIFKFE
jgi:hypothetical protein